MSVSPRMLTPRSALSHTGSIAPPAWVARLFTLSAEPTVDLPGFTLTNLESESNRWITATIIEADAMDHRDFAAKVTAAYAEIFATLRAGRLQHPVRFWNFLPNLHPTDSPARDRYHDFNAGRHTAFAKHFGGESRFSESVATASAVGHDGNDLVIHCLARSSAGVPIDNPQQIRPYQYSEKYGERPPCFARGTLVDAQTLFVGGTASIAGEDSLHAEDLAAQTQQTLANLSSVVSSSNIADDCPLDMFRSLRVYHPRAGDREPLLELLADSFPRVSEIEMVRAEICRKELLVEIEGVCGKALEGCAG